MSNQSVDFSPIIYGDFFRLFAGELLGEGSSRKVYECSVDSSLVIKIESNAQSFQNILEWENWRSWWNCKDVSRWLAPCINISPCGSVLLQKRTEPVKSLPRTLPLFLTDRKQANFGLIKNNFVCHDYAYIISNLSHKKTKATWGAA